MRKEFTRKELSDYFEQNSKNGKISFEALGKLIFDTDFPEEDYENAKNNLIDMQKESERFREIPEIMDAKLKNAKNILNEVYELEQQGVSNTENLMEEYNKINMELKALESEFLSLKAKIKERTKE